MLVTAQRAVSSTEDYVMVERDVTQADASDRSVSSNIDVDLISRTIEQASDDLRRISLTIHDDPELQFKEFHAHEVLTDYLKGQSGWDVTLSAYGLKTAFVAIFDSKKKGPVVSFNAEYDALVGIGHACGHNLIAMVSLGAALATAQVMKEHELGGKVVLFGTPAEGKFPVNISDSLISSDIVRAYHASGMTDSVLRRRWRQDQTTEGRSIF